MEIHESRKNKFLVFMDFLQILQIIFHLKITFKTPLVVKTALKMKGSWFCDASARQPKQQHYKTCKSPTNCLNGKRDLKTNRSLLNVTIITHLTAHTVILLSMTQIQG